MQYLSKCLVLLCCTLAMAPLKGRAALANTDIGSPGVSGSVTSAGNGYDVTGAGTNMFGVADQFSFAYEQLSGDFDVKARFQSFTAANAFAKSGLMARESLAVNSRFAASLAGPSIYGSVFVSRAATAGSATQSGSFPANYPYTWLRLQRSGNVFNGYGGFDGKNWTLLGTTSLAVPTTVYVGFATCSADSAQSAAAQARDYGSAAGGSVVPFVASREPLGPSSRHTGLVISEIMYHPKARPDGKQLEYIELYNSMSIWEDLSGYRIAGDINFTFPDGTIIQPGQFMVLAKIAADVQSVYGISGVFEYGITNGFNTNVVNSMTNVTPNVDNSLSNGGGRIQLRSKAGAVLLDISFGTKYPWPIEADGGGHSLVLARPSYGEGDLQAWAASDSIGGSPGGFDPITPEPARDVVINEFLANTDPPLEDMVELYNHGNSAVDISGYWLSDDVSTNKFRIPDGTVLTARGFAAFTQTQLGFALSAAGEQILLVNSNQTRVVDSIGFGGQETGVSMGRYPDGAPTFRRLSAITQGTTNAPPLQSPIVINEIMYSPISGNNDDEFVELYNRSTNAVNIGNWKFTSGINFTFPPNTIVPTGGYMVVAKNANHLKANYNNLGPANLMGDFGGTMANGGERIALAAPDYEVTTNTSGQLKTNVAFHFVINEVTYNKGGKWGVWSDDGGSSLELIDPDADNAQPSNWADSDESAKSTWTSFEFTGQVDNQQTGEGNGDRVQLIMLGIGECLIDDIEVRNSLNANVLVNGSFENGLTGWTLQGSHDQSFVENTGFSGFKSLHLMAESRGDNGGNRIQSALSPAITSGMATMRAKARWIRGFPEVLLRLRGGGLEAFGRLPVPANLGTPGARNSRAVGNAGPAIYDVTHYPALPNANEAVRVVARVTDPDGVSQLMVRYRPNSGTPFSLVTMRDDGTGGDGVAGDGLFTATIPGQASGVQLAFHVMAVDGKGATNLFPANALNYAFPNDAPTHECVIRWGDVQMPGSFATYHMWFTDWSPDGVNQRWSNRHKLDNAGLWATFVYNNYRVIYGVKPQYGGSPWHSGQMNGPINTGSRVDYVMNFPEDDLLLGQTDFVLNTVGNPSGNSSSDSSGLIEQTSYEIFKAIGIHYNYRRYVHVFLNGNQRSVTSQFSGNFIMEDSQQPNGDVVAEWNPDDANGQLYKIEDWFEFADDGLSHVNDDADLQRRSTPLPGNPMAVKLSPYRFMWRKRSVSAADSANNYTNILSVVDIISPAATPAVSPLTDTIVKQFSQVVDFEQWMRIFAVQHTIGNWDSYGYERGKNCYTYRPDLGKFQLLTWDIDFTLGIGGNGTGQDLFDINDQRVAALCNTPETVRAYWRALKDIVNGPLNNSYLNPLIDARAAAFRANNVSYDPNSISTVKNYISGRRSYIVSLLPSANFAITSATNFTSSTNIVTLTGTAPIEVKFIEINGINYPITWGGTRAAPTTWTLRLPMSVTGSNGFTLTAYDRLGNPIPNTTRTVAVNYTGAVAGPETNIVFNEIMYNPLVPGAEYVELFNRAANFTFDLSGWRINGLGYTFPEGATIGPRAYLVLTKDRIAFANAYGGTVPVFDQFPGQLQASGETLTLIQPGATPAQDLVVDKVRYDSSLPWPPAADGTGSSLQLFDSGQDNSRVGNWFASYVPAVYSEPMSTPSHTNDGWRFVSATGSVGPGIGGGQMRLVIYLGSELGSAIIDDISLVPGTDPVVGPNYVRNGDFESSPLLEDPPLTNSWSIGTNYTNTVIINSLTHSGNGALRIEASTFSSVYPRLIAQNLSPAPPANSTNTLSFWFWATNSSTNLSVRLFNSANVNVATNINVSITPSNYVPPMLITPATNTLTPAVVNQNATSITPFPTLWINELQPDNLNGIVDNAAEHDPWLELYNSGAASVSLDGLYLSSNYANLTNWAFPAGRSIPAGGFLVIFCDGQPAQTTATELHTSFRLASGSGSIALSRIDNGAPQVLDYINYSALHSDRSYGSFPDGQPFDRQEFFYMTPGAANDGRSAPLNVFINEWMAINAGYLADPADFNYDDWFELYNPGTNAVDLAGYYLTDTLTDKFKFKIPNNAAHIIPPGDFLLVWADNEPGQNSSGGVPRPDLHVNFQLASGGEAIGLFAADGTQIDAITFGQQTTNVSEGRFPNGGQNIYTMTNPTPRGPNYIPGAGNSAPVLHAIGSQSVFLAQTVAFVATASDPDPGQALRFSLDAGAPPGATIDPVTGAFTWTPSAIGTTVITVRVTDNGSPALDDYENVAVHVTGPPSFATPSISGSDLTLTWPATFGRTYRVEFKNNLNDPDWILLGQELTATSDTLSISDDVSGSPQRFYRLVVVP